MWHNPEALSFCTQGVSFPCQGGHSQPSGCSPSIWGSCVQLQWSQGSSSSFLLLLCGRGSEQALAHFFPVAIFVGPFLADPCGSPRTQFPTCVQWHQLLLNYQRFWQAMCCQHWCQNQWGSSWPSSYMRNPTAPCYHSLMGMPNGVGRQPVLGGSELDYGGPAVGRSRGKLLGLWWWCMWGEFNLGTQAEPMPHGSHMDRQARTKQWIWTYA